MKGNLNTTIKSKKYWGGGGERVQSQDNSLLLESEAGGLDFGVKFTSNKEDPVETWVKFHL
jgi:hypothetical protein